MRGQQYDPEQRHEHEHDTEHRHEHDEVLRRSEPADSPASPGSHTSPELVPHLLRAAASGRTDAIGPSGMGTLQRTVGNSAVTSMLQREGEAEGGDEQRRGQGRSSVHEVISSSDGRALDPATRSDMESRLGSDFSDVRVHTGSAAHASARDVGARAYTVGSDVVFQRDAYDPSSHAGRTTLAHELTHVIQQRNGPVDGTEAPGGIRVSDPSDRFEQEASANAERVMAQPERDAAGGTAGSTGQAEAPAPPSAPVAADAPAVQREAGSEDEDEQPADVQGEFVQRAPAGGGKKDEEEEETPAE